MTAIARRVLKPAVSPARTIVLLGDSVTRYNHPSNSSGTVYSAAPALATDTTNTYFRPIGFFHWLNALLGQRFEVIAYSGVSGDTYADMEARLDTDVLAFDTKYCFVQGSANGIAAGLTAAAELASLQSIVNRLRNVGIIPIVSKLGYNALCTGAKIDEWIDLSLSMMSWLKQQDVITVDLEKGMGDTATTTSPRMLASFGSDGLHPDINGAQYMGINGFNQLDKLIPESHITPEFNTDYKTGVLNPLQVGTGGTVTGTGASGSIPPNWKLTATQSSSEAVAAAKVARTDGEMGEWTQLTFSGTAGDTTESFQYESLVVTNADSGFVTGDRIATFVEMRVTTALVNIMPNMWTFFDSASLDKIFTRSGAGDFSASMVDKTFILRLGDVVLGTELSTNDEQVLIEFYPVSAAAISGVINIGRVWMQKVA